MSEFLSLIGGVLIGAAILAAFSINPDDVKSGEVFEYLDSKYQCREVAKRDWVETGILNPEGGKE